LIENDGWSLHSQKGSHRQYKHPKKAGRVTIPGHPKTLASVVKQAQLERIKE
jgi:predicted RNA binding protein YcfA (HicA-like mRNA interferase family)